MAQVGSESIGQVRLYSNAIGYQLQGAFVSTRKFKHSFGT